MQRVKASDELKIHDHSTRSCRRQLKRPRAQSEVEKESGLAQEGSRMNVDCKHLLRLHTKKRETSRVKATAETACQCSSRPRQDWRSHGYRTRHIEQWNPQSLVDALAGWKPATMLLFHRSIHCRFPTTRASTIPCRGRDTAPGHDFLPPSCILFSR